MRARPQKGPCVSRIRKIIAGVASAAAETFWPTRCVSCNLPGALLCAECEKSLPYINVADACPRCGAPFSAYVCTECPMPGSVDRCGRLVASPFAFSAARAACSYEGVAKKLLRAYKDADESRLAPFIAQAIAQVVRADAPEQDWTQWADAFTCVPANPKNLLRRGYDHMEPIATELERELGLMRLDVLASHAAADQRHLGQQERLANRKGSFFVKSGVRTPAHVLLIDDVLTTGATASAAAEALFFGGVTEVRVAVFARVW